MAPDHVRLNQQGYREERPSLTQVHRREAQRIARSVRLIGCHVLDVDRLTLAGDTAEAGCRACLEPASTDEMLAKRIGYPAHADRFECPGLVEKDNAELGVTKLQCLIEDHIEDGHEVAGRLVHGAKNVLEGIACLERIAKLALRVGRFQFPLPPGVPPGRRLLERQLGC